MSKNIVGFDLENDLLMALRNLSNSLTSIEIGEVRYLKWSVIFAHTSLQAAMCLSLITSASYLVRQKSSYDDNCGDLDNVEWLYQKLQNEEIISYMGSKVIPNVVGQLDDVKRLQKIRNTFIHQQPDLYIFTIEELQKLIVLAVKLIRFLVSESERMAIGAYVSKSTLEQQIDIIEAQLTKQSN